MVNVRQKRGAASYRRGWLAEIYCIFYLVIKGYRLLARRYVTRAGEIDLIAMRGNEVVFVEVKARPTLDQAKAAISEQQKVRLRKSAALYLSGRSTLVRCNLRFDAILVVPWRKPVHVENAF